MIRQVREGSWEAPALQGRAVGGDQACRGRKLGQTGWQGRKIDINQAGRQNWLGAIRKAGSRAVGSQHRIGSKWAFGHLSHNPVEHPVEMGS